MPPFVILLRGINVGGKNILPMLKFRELLVSLGCDQVATYIQSGNAICIYSGEATELSDRVAAAIEAQFGFRPSVLVLPSSSFLKVAAANPYLANDIDPKFLHIWFLQAPARQADRARLDDSVAADEKYTLTDAAFYLHAPNGIGRSKLAKDVERCLGVQATARNSRTVSKICEMLAAVA